PLVFFTDSATPVIYTLSLHDALPIFPVGRDEPDRPHVGDAAVEGRIPRLVGNPGVRPRLEVALRPNPDLQLASAREVGNDEATLGIGLDGADARTGSDLHLRTFDGLHLVSLDPTDHAAAGGRGQDLHLVVVTFRFVLGAGDQESAYRRGDDDDTPSSFHRVPESIVHGQSRFPRGASSHAHAVTCKKSFDAVAPTRHRRSSGATAWIGTRILFCRTRTPAAGPRGETSKRTARARILRPVPDGDHRGSHGETLIVRSVARCRRTPEAASLRSVPMERGPLAVSGQAAL